jgi:hypothetical protein
VLRAGFGDPVPADGAVDVPIDAQPGWLVQAGCGGTVDVQLGLYLDGEPSPVVVASAVAGEGGSDGFVRVDVALQADTAYRMVGTTSDGQSVEAGFETGSRLAALLSGELVLVAEEATWWGQERNYDISVVHSLTRADDPHEMSVVEIVEASDPERVVGATGPSGGDRVVTRQREEVLPDELCFVARQLGPAGDVVESEPSCITELEAGDPGSPLDGLVECGCRSGGSAASGGLLPLLMVLWRRRR